MIRLTPPLSSWRRSISRITSLAEHHCGSSPSSLTPQIWGMRMCSGRPVIASATSNPPTPIASMPSDPAAGVCESEPTMVLPGIPNRCMCVGCDTPLPGLENHSPNLCAAVRRYSWSSAFFSSVCSRLWSTYCTLTSVRARSSPRASSSCITSVPVASCVRVWSMWIAISSPGVISPDSRWDSISFRATLSDMTCTYPDPAAATRPRELGGDRRLLVDRDGRGQRLGNLIGQAVGVELEKVDDVILAVDHDHFLGDGLFLAVLGPGAAQLVGRESAQVVFVAVAHLLEAGQVLRRATREFDQLLRVDITLELGDRRDEAG